MISEAHGSGGLGGVAEIELKVAFIMVSRMYGKSYENEKYLDKAKKKNQSLDVFVISSTIVDGIYVVR